MPENDPNLVPIEDRQMVRDMRSKAILSRDVTARAAYMKRRAARARKANEAIQMRQENAKNRIEIAELRTQIEALSKLVQSKVVIKKKTNRKKKSEDS